MMFSTDALEGAFIKRFSVEFFSKFIPQCGLIERVTVK